MSSSKKSSALSKLSRKELISMNNELKKENSLLRSELNHYRNESKKIQKTSESEALDRQTVNKKSFSDRICDDLCEEILQYLSLEDKLKLEGVSKQFQRTVLKHNELTIRSCNYMYKDILKDYKYLFIERSFITMKSLEVLLKKFPNIRSIELQGYNESGFNPVIRLITKYCNNLRQFKMYDNQIKDQNIKAFQRKFGPKLKNLVYMNEIDYNLFPNIEELISYDKENIKLVLPHLKLKQLKKLKIDLKEGEEYMIKTFVETFPTLTHLDYNYFSRDSDLNYSSLNYISNLKNLIHFGFDYYLSELNTKLFCDSLKRMANNCQKLKSIDCCFKINSNSFIKQLFSTFEAFPALKRLNVRFHCFEEDFNTNKWFPFEAFKRLSNLTHLTLQFPCHINLNYFKDIDIKLAKLQYLNFKTPIIGTLEDETQITDILSRLSRLQTLKLVFFRFVNFDEIKMREKCRKIRTIDIKHNKRFSNYH